MNIHQKFIFTVTHTYSATGYMYCKRQLRQGSAYDAGSLIFIGPSISADYYMYICRRHTEIFQENDQTEYHTALLNLDLIEFITNKIYTIHNTSSPNETPHIM